MNPIYKIALKNITFNKKRSIVTILLGVISTALLIFLSALTDGSHNKMLKNAVEVYPGYIQITHKDFRDNPSFEHLIFDKNLVLNKLQAYNQIDTFSSRFETSVLFSSGDKSIGAMITGIDPKKEERLSKINSSLLKGEYLDNNDRNSLYIGDELAKRLKVDIGDSISFIGSGADYSFTADILKIKGIFKTGLYDFDANSAFLNSSYFDEIFLSSNFATTIIVLPKDIKNSLELSLQIDKNLPKELESKSWEQFMSSLLKAMELDTIFGYLTLSIFFIVIAFVILIYTLLVVYSRIKTIGVLKAIGTSKAQIRDMLIFESTVLSVFSAVIGGIVGGYLAYYFNINPIDYGTQFDEQFKQYGMMVTTMPTEFNIVNIFRDIIIIFILNILSTLYPIFKINSYKPIEAINHV
ncbi:MAG: FtsX-like permease family protein [Campylobacterota bacterium]|nr:FtsX-like permease family protein [Campylobacterota bacterium]